MPADGCNAITTEGTCYRYFISTGIKWADSRAQCVSRGYDLATITSSEENALMYNITFTTSRYCWIGLSDIDNEGTFVWADGRNSMYRHWADGEPNDFRDDEDCVHTFGQPKWNDLVCTGTMTCYSCGTKGNTFGDSIPKINLQRKSYYYIRNVQKLKRIKIPKSFRSLIAHVHF